MLIPIAAILVGGIIAINRSIFVHRERLAMIREGIHPDTNSQETQHREHGREDS